MKSIFTNTVGLFSKVKTKNKLLVLSVLFFASHAVLADSFKVGYVDVSKIFTKSVPAVSLQGALKEKFTLTQQELQTMNSDLMNSQKQMQTIIAKAPTMDKLTKTDKQTLEVLQSKYQKDQLNFQKKYALYNQEIQKSQDFASGLLLGRVNTILKKISDSGGYDLVLTSAQLVYIKSKYDLTDQVIKELDKVKGEELIKELNDAEKNAAKLNQGQSNIDNKSIISPK